jgi:hypothetical protein
MKLEKERMSQLQKKMDQLKKQQIIEKEGQ